MVTNSELQEQINDYQKIINNIKEEMIMVDNEYELAELVTQLDFYENELLYEKENDA